MSIYIIKFVQKVLINDILPLVEIMAWRQPGDKQLFEPWVVSLLTHMCVTQPQWVKCISRLQSLQPVATNITSTISKLYRTTK